MERFRAIVTLIVAAAFTGCNSTNAIPNHPGSQAGQIKHIIVMMQENRSFNNVFAGFPGADTALSGACRSPVVQDGHHKIHSVSLETTGHLGLGTDIDHSHNGFEIECDSTLRRVSAVTTASIRFATANPVTVRYKAYPYAYIERSETKAYWDFASRYGLADHFFNTDTASSFIAHQLILSGTVALNSRESVTDQPDAMPWGCDGQYGEKTPVLHKNGKEGFGGPFPCFTQWGTMADLLDAANISWKYYVAPGTGKGNDFAGGVWNGYDANAKIRCNTYSVPVKGPSDCHGSSASWKAHMSFPNTTFFTDVKNGTLPSLSYVIPDLDKSDHPASGCNHGPRWVTSVIDAVGKSKYWNSTAILLLWDDWGGFYDPVPPPQVNYTSLGFRIPFVLISPYARPKYVSSTQYEYGSVLKFIEQTFGLGSLHTTDASSNSIVDMFDMTQKPTSFLNEPLPSQKPCPSQGITPQQIIDHDGGVPE